MAALGWRENLSALPDLDAECTKETLPSGITVLTSKSVNFVPYDVGETDPLTFTDAEGTWFVVYGREGGPHKRFAFTVHPEQDGVRLRDIHAELSCIRDGIE